MLKQSSIIYPDCSVFARSIWIPRDEFVVAVEQFLGHVAHWPSQSLLSHLEEIQEQASPAAALDHR
jgi:hypothetical protein